MERWERDKRWKAGWPMKKVTGFINSSDMSNKAKTFRLKSSSRDPPERKEKLGDLEA
jgi:hypothetical protein